MSDFRTIVKRAASMGSCSQTHHEYIAADALAALAASETPSEPPTHGRHCPCSACARQDWTDPNLGPCGMHGPSCPPVYAPLTSESPSDPERLTSDWMSAEQHIAEVVFRGAFPFAARLTDTAQETQ